MALFLGDKLIGTNSIGTRIVEKDVNFYDYEGTLVASYTKQEALALTALPQLPDRTSENLTNEGWNWTLQEIKTQLNDVGGIVNVGCIYDTTDKNCYFFIKVRPDDNKFGIKCKASVSNGATIYWGDGTSTVMSTTIDIKSHTYDVTEDTCYTVKVQIDDGYMVCSSDMLNDSYFTECVVEKYFLSSKFTAGDYTFRVCYSVKNISISNTAWSTINNKTNVFYGCFSLTHINVGRNVSVIGTYWFYDCYSLRSICLPATITSIGDRFGNTVALDAITIPKGVTSIGSYFSYRLGGYLSKLAIPNTVTSISNNFLGYYKYIEEFSVPSGVTVINTALIPYAHNLRKLTFEGQVISFGSNITNGISNLSSIYIKATTPPIVQSDSFTKRSDCKIYVPRDSYNDYITASNWSDWAANIVPYDY